MELTREQLRYTLNCIASHCNGGLEQLDTFRSISQSLVCFPTPAQEAAEKLVRDVKEGVGIQRTIWDTEEDCKEKDKALKILKHNEKVIGQWEATLDEAEPEERIEFVVID